MEQNFMLLEDPVIVVEMLRVIIDCPTKAELTLQFTLMDFFPILKLILEINLFLWGFVEPEMDGILILVIPGAKAP